MLTDEVITLITIEEAGRTSNRLTNYPREITYERINYIGSALVSSGHLVVNSPEGYQLTSKGWNAILGEAIRLVACEDEAWVKYRMERLEQLYDEISQQADNFIRKQQRFSLEEEYSTMLQI